MHYQNLYEKASNIESSWTKTMKWNKLKGRKRNLSLKKSVKFETIECRWRHIWTMNRSERMSEMVDLYTNRIQAHCKKKVGRRKKWHHVHKKVTNCCARDQQRKEVMANERPFRFRRGPETFPFDAAPAWRATKIHPANFCPVWPVRVARDWSTDRVAADRACTSHSTGWRTCSRSAVCVLFAQKDKVQSRN